MLAITRFKRAPVRVQAAILRQQGRMDIDHAPDPWAQRIAINHAHVTGQHQPLRAAGCHALQQVVIERAPIRVAARVQCQCRHARSFGQAQRGCGRLVAAHQYELHG